MLVPEQVERQKAKGAWEASRLPLTPASVGLGGCWAPCSGTSRERAFLQKETVTFFLLWEGAAVTAALQRAAPRGRGADAVWGD